MVGMAMSKLEDAHQRLERCGADQELVQLTKECLLSEPSALPESAAVLAGKIRDYLAQAEAKTQESNGDLPSQ